MRWTLYSILKGLNFGRVGQNSLALKIRPFDIIHCLISQRLAYPDLSNDLDRRREASSAQSISTCQFASNWHMANSAKSWVLSCSLNPSMEDHTNLHIQFSTSELRGSSVAFLYRVAAEFPESPSNRSSVVTAWRICKRFCSLGAFILALHKTFYSKIRIDHVFMTISRPKEMYFRVKSRKLDLSNNFRFAIKWQLRLFQGWNFTITLIIGSINLERINIFTLFWLSFR